MRVLLVLVVAGIGNAHALDTALSGRVGRSAPQPIGRDPVEARCTQPVVLLYHAFDRGTSDLSTSSAALERHLTWLEQNQVELITMDRFVAFFQGRERLPRRVAVLTIDDGDATVYTRAWPILRRHEAHFVLGLPTKLMESGRRGMLTWDQVREMVGTGLAEVASHGYEHRGLTGLRSAEAARQLALSRRIIEERVGRAPVAFFYPLGAVDARAEDEVRRAGFEVAFTAQGAPMVANVTNPMRIPRVTVRHDQDERGVAWFFGAKFWSGAARFQAGCEEPGR
jgi:biofilm PGA synthesis lipoprotein PgaB